MTVQLYAWQPRRSDLEEAKRRLTQALGRLASQFQQAYGRPFRVRCVASDVAVVGTIGYEVTVSGGTGWIGDDAAGAAFAGAVEAQPRSEPTDLDQVRTALLATDGTPADAATVRAALSLPGRWTAAAWQAGETVVMNGAAMGRSLWWTDGPDGWAVGSQARPLLELVGRPAELDLDRAALSVAFGYIVGCGSLYAGARRLGPGERIVMRPGDPPRVDRPVSLHDILGPRDASSDEDPVDAFAERLTGLVSGELAISGDAHVGLSGGRDSRLLAAAAVRGGWHPRATTGGPATSPDVVVARRVAEALGLNHTSSADPVAGDTPDQHIAREAGGVGRSQPMTKARLATWIALSDGTAPASLAWVARDLSQPLPTSTSAVGQTLTGLGGETHRGVYFSGARDLDRPGSARRGPRLVLDLFAARSNLRRPVRDLLAAEIEATDGLDDGSISLSEWLSRFHWRFRENCRGSDTLARGDLASWTWAPLTDAGLLAVSRRASAASRSSSRFVEEATIRLAPQLTGVPYDRTVMARPPEWMLRLVARLGLLRQARRFRSRAQGERGPARSAERRARLSAFWEEVYFGPGDHVWPELIDAARLRQLVRDEPDGQVVKALAVPELLLRDDLLNN